MEATAFVEFVKLIRSSSTVLVESRGFLAASSFAMDLRKVI